MVKCLEAKFLASSVVIIICHPPFAQRNVNQTIENDVQTVTKHGANFYGKVNKTQLENCPVDTYQVFKQIPRILRFVLFLAPESKNWAPQDHFGLKSK